MKNFNYYKGDMDACLAAWRKYIEICSENGDNLRADTEFYQWLFHEHREINEKFTNLDYYNHFRLCDVIDSFRYDKQISYEDIDKFEHLKITGLLDDFGNWLQEKYKNQ